MAVQAQKVREMRCRPRQYDQADRMHHDGDGDQQAADGEFLDHEISGR